MTVDSPRLLPIGRTVTLSKLLAGEIAVGTAVNLVLNLFFAWAAFPAGAAVTVRGWPGLAIDLLPATIIPAVMMTIVVTALLRRRLDAGLRVATRPTLPFALPRSIGWRAVAVAVLALGLVALPTLVALLLLWPAAGSRAQLIAFKLVFSAFHAAVLTPIVILAGLADARR